MPATITCELCGSPDTDVRLELRGEGAGVLVCARSCGFSRHARRRRIARLTPRLLDQIEAAADAAWWWPVPDVDPSVLHALVAVARRMT